MRVEVLLDEPELKESQLVERQERLRTTSDL
jgi:hypothetical protein